MNEKNEASQEPGNTAGGRGDKVDVLGLLAGRRGARIQLGFDLEHDPEVTLKNDRLDLLVVSADSDPSPLDQWMPVLARETGWPLEEIQALAEQVQQDERVTLVACPTREQDSSLKGFILCPGGGAQANNKTADPGQEPSSRDLYYNVTLQALLHGVCSMGAKRIGMTHLSACEKFTDEIACSHGQALARFADGFKGKKLKTFYFLGCCIQVDHLKAMSRLNEEGGQSGHFGIEVQTEALENATRLVLSWEKLEEESERAP